MRQMRRPPPHLSTHLPTRCPLPDWPEMRQGTPKVRQLQGCPPQLATQLSGCQNRTCSSSTQSNLLNWPLGSTAEGVVFLRGGLCPEPL